MVKHVLANKFGFYPKLDAHPYILALLGKGLVLVQGSEWARHRRILNPAFTMDKLKVSLLFKNTSHRNVKLAKPLATFSMADVDKKDGRLR